MIHVVRMAIFLMGIFLLSLLIVLLMNPHVIRSLPLMDDPELQSFKTMFVSLTLEALPFLLLGVLVSSLIQVFVPESWIRRIIPRHPLLGAIVASLLGIVFPVCECGMVPVARRLIQKGFPVYAAVVFLLAGPIVNPVVYSSTSMAFRATPSIAYSRMALAVLVSVIVGWMLLRFVRWDPMRPETRVRLRNHDRGHNHDHHRHSHRHNEASSKWMETLDHAAGEFFDMGKYFIFGAFLTSIIQTFVPRSVMLDIAQSDGAATVLMMAFAYIISICSTSDAFVASSFASTFSPGALLAFLVFGPMLDVKSTWMLLSVFKARFVALLALLTAVCVWMGSRLFEMLM